MPARLTDDVRIQYALLRAQGMSQREAARLLGVDRHTVQRWESQPEMRQRIEEARSQLWDKTISRTAASISETLAQQQTLMARTLAEFTARLCQSISELDLEEIPAATRVQVFLKLTAMLIKHLAYQEGNRTSLADLLEQANARIEAELLED